MNCLEKATPSQIKDVVQAVRRTVDCRTVDGILTDKQILLKILKVGFTFLHDAQGRSVFRNVKKPWPELACELMSSHTPLHPDGIRLYGSQYRHLDHRLAIFDGIFLLYEQNIPLEALYDHLSGFAENASWLTLEEAMKFLRAAKQRFPTGHYRDLLMKVVQNVGPDVLEGLVRV